MLWVGLTGSLGTGKSTVTSILQRLGYQVVDADLIAHQVLRPGEKSYQQVVHAFGPEILDPDKSIDRKKLAQLVFGKPEKLRILESIVHPEIKFRVKQEKEALAKAHHKIAFYDVPLLFEKNMKNDFDKILVVATNEKLQRERLRARNNWTDVEIDLRLKSQIPIQEKINLADYLITNDSGLNELEENVRRILASLLPKTSI